MKRGVRRKRLLFQVLPLRCGQLPVVVGAAPAADLVAASFADVLDEGHDIGYQRPIDARHSTEFRNYIEQPNATTIPLTFNLRGPEGEHWRLLRSKNGLAKLWVDLPTPEKPACLAQVDCQHRLGMMSKSTIPLTFQCYLGLTPAQEMAIFNVINGKARGLDPSLLDYHATKLIPNIEDIRLELFVAKRLQEDPTSVWKGRVRLGGKAAQGTYRPVSLRGLQVATKVLLHNAKLDVPAKDPVGTFQIVKDFWTAVTEVWPEAWARPRTHLLTKGIGVNALSLLAADIHAALLAEGRTADKSGFVVYLSRLSALDWSTDGVFKGLGGRHGANAAHDTLKKQLFTPNLVIARSARQASGDLRHAT